MANISDFKARMLGGGARPNQFRVELTFPTFVGAGSAVGNTSQFLCKATTLPQSAIDNIQVMYRGRQVNFAGEKTFTPWSVDIYNDVNFSVRNAFERWSNGVQENARTNGITNPLQYQVDLLVHQLDRNGAVIKTYRFVDAYPTNVGQIALDYDANTSIEIFPVEFHYNYWTSDTTPIGVGTAIGGVASLAQAALGGFPLNI
jgi:hypothetical protein